MFLLPLLWLIFFWLLAMASLVVFNLALVRFFERLIPPLGRFIEVDGVRLHVVDSGDRPGQSGPPLLFVHGLLGQLNHFSFALAALFPERRVVLLDRPGAGYSQAAPSQDLEAQADLAAKLIDRLSLRRPLVVGHSLGGAVALALALDRAEKIGGLALIAPLTHPTRTPKPFIALATHSRLALRLGAWTLGPIVSLLQSAAVRTTIFAPEPLTPGFWIAAGGRLAGRPSAMIAAARDMRGFAKDLPGMAARYPSLKIPVGVLYGKGDVVLDPNAQGAFFCAQTPGADLTLIEGGHMLPVTQPKATESFIRKVLARLDTALIS